MWYFFPPLLQKAEILVVLVKKSFFCKKNAVVKNVSPCGRVMSPLGRVIVAVWSGNVAVAKSYVWNYLKISKNAVPQIKGCSFGKPIFRVKGRNLAP